ncbi:hypothetical protein [Spiroplasma turonicum]|uniref:Uncharacterized protein n=1 Tax=Spiroplasma turonicum TaxID=216946 RepID=A0A0K1P5T3_9MOLU|nr:hypothetical protein [Spiroplasma turonicum]AKU79668.1 hypothetical protein STURON_00422 [Spiroplasma turonicum]ALX70688.1 hypothetical protein STURO_v1c04200 [Spiroplasma turonicum]
MKKLVLLSSFLLSSIAFSSSFFLINNGSNSSETSSKTNNSTSDDIDNNKYLDQMNDINKNLDYIPLLSPSKIIEEFKNKNKKFADCDVKVKEFSEKTARITVKDFIGFVDINFKVNSLSGLFDIKDITQIPDYSNEGIMSAIESKNPNLKTFNKSTFQYSLKSINKFEIYAPSINATVSFNISPKSLSTLITNTIITRKIDDPYNENKIIDAVAEVNPLINMDKSLILVDKSSITYNGAVIYSNKSFDSKSRITINYKVNSITNMISNLDLGLVNSFEDKNLINDFLNKNSVLKDYYSSGYLDIKINQKKATNSSVLIKKIGTSISSNITFNYKASDISLLITKPSLSNSIEKYSKLSPNQQLKSAVMNENSYLSEFSSYNLSVSNIKYDSYNVNDTYINYSYNLSLSSYNGSKTITGKIHRPNIYSSFTTRDLGTVDWSNANQVINKIRDSNKNVNFNEIKPINVNSYNKGVVIEAKEDSFIYSNMFTITMDSKIYSADYNIKASVSENPDSERVSGGVYNNSSFLALRFAENEGWTNNGVFRFETKNPYPLAINSSTFSNINNKYLKYSFDFNTYRMRNSEKTDYGMSESWLKNYDVIDQNEIVPLSKVLNGYTGQFKKVFYGVKVKERGGFWSGYCNSSDSGTRDITAYIDYKITIDNNKIVFNFTSSWYISKGVECWNTQVYFKYSIRWVSIE